MVLENSAVATGKGGHWKRTGKGHFSFQSLRKAIPKDQSWVLIRRTDDEAQTPVLWSPHEKS